MEDSQEPSGTTRTQVQTNRGPPGGAETAPPKKKIRNGESQAPIKVIAGTIPAENENQDQEDQEASQDQPRIKIRSKVPVNLQKEAHSQKKTSVINIHASTSSSRLSGKAMFETGLILSRKLTDNSIDRVPVKVYPPVHAGDGRYEPGASENLGG